MQRLTLNDCRKAANMPKNSSVEVSVGSSPKKTTACSNCDKKSNLSRSRHYIMPVRPHTSAFISAMSASILVKADIAVAVNLSVASRKQSPGSLLGRRWWYSISHSISFSSDFRSWNSFSSSFRLGRGEGGGEGRGGEGREGKGRGGEGEGEGRGGEGRGGEGRGGEGRGGEGRGRGRGIRSWFKPS